VGDLVVRDAEWDERGKIEQWQAVGREIEDMPPTLAAAILCDAWETLEPLQNKHWLGPLVVSAWLRSRRKVASHLFCLNVGRRRLRHEGDLSACPGAGANAAPAAVQAFVEQSARCD
jgi:hypothetical protein